MSEAIEKEQIQVEPINYALFLARNKLKLTRKEAAKKLGICTLHLQLIEKGYLKVKKKLQPRFIDFYKLDEDFFIKNSTYVKPIDRYVRNADFENKIRNILAKRPTKIISGGLSLLLMGIVAIGAVYFTNPFTHSRSLWTQGYTAITEGTRNAPDETSTSSSLLDTKYSIIENDEMPNAKIKFTFYTYGLDYNCDESEFMWQVSYVDADTREGHEVDAGDVATIESYAHNRKRYLSVNFNPNDKNKGKISTICIYQSGIYVMDKVYILKSGVINSYDVGSPEYTHYHNLLFEDGLLDFSINRSTKMLQSRFASTIPANYGFNDYMGDNQVISRSYTSSSWTGYLMMLLGSVIWVVAIAVFILAFLASHTLRPKTADASSADSKTEYVDTPTIVYRSIPNDAKLSPFIPEAVLRVVGLLILLLSSIGYILVTNSIISGDISSIHDAREYAKFMSNILIAGTMLLFFVKLDVYSKRTNKQLITSTILFFFEGVMFYFFEILTYLLLTTGNGAVGSAVEQLADYIPGNIVWNLMLYALLFFFLFTVPERIKKKPHMVMLWHLGSLIPTLIMFFSFIFIAVIKPNANVPFVVSCLFYSKSAILSMFAMIYLYSLFFIQQYKRLKYGDNLAEIYFESRRYAWFKNSLACIVIVFLLIIDLSCRFLLPNNKLKLGDNYAIGFLIPLILLYRPHIGKRNSFWDNSYLVLYGVCYAIGPVVSVLIVLVTLMNGDLIAMLR